VDFRVDFGLTTKNDFVIFITKFFGRGSIITVGKILRLSQPCFSFSSFFLQEKMESNP